MLCFLLMRIWVFLFLMILVALPSLVFAQDGGLVTCGGGTGDTCDTNDVVTFAQGLIEFLIKGLGVIAVIVMVYAGFKLVVSAGNESEWTKAKELFTNVIIGIILILAAWLIIDTVLKGLTGKGLPDWSSELSTPAGREASRQSTYCQLNPGATDCR